MQTVHYYFDESGEKGFISPDYQDTDLGLVAGIALPEGDVAKFESQVAAILSKIDSSQVKKLHATEVFKDGANAETKAELLDFLANRPGWLLVYEAIYPLGIYKREAANAKILAENKPKNPRVLVSGNQKKTRIYTALLEGIIVKLDEVSRIEGSDSVVMFSDRLDKGLFKEAEERLAELKAEITTTNTSGFDTVTKEILRGSVSFQVLGFDSAVHFVKEIKTEVATSTMTIVADFISNTLYRHLKVTCQSNTAVRLHSHRALEGYALKHQIAFIDDNSVIDSLYSVLE